PDSYGSGGEPNPDCVSNILIPWPTALSPPSAYSSSGIPTSSATAICGMDGNGITVSGNNVALICTINIVLIGYYSSVNGVTLNKKGIIDIVGAVPAIIGEANTRRGYLNLRNNVSRETAIDRFYVVSVKGTGGEKIVGGDSSYPNSIPHVIVYFKKYAGALF
ncbi:MAG: hypothetical protein LBL45_07975, partial [Treponema sp.]|nr:hypothetical protein [Treponema sp.]